MIDRSSDPPVDGETVEIGGFPAATHAVIGTGDASGHHPKQHAPPLGVSPPLDGRLATLPTLHLALLCDPFAFIRDPLALVRQAQAPGGGRLALGQALITPLERLGQLLAPQREPLTLRGNLLPLLGYVLALRRNSLAFPSHPNQLLRLVRRLLRLGEVRGVERQRTLVDRPCADSAVESRPGYAGAVQQPFLRRPRDQAATIARNSA
jgi:hypothetical protein